MSYLFKIQKDSFKRYFILSIGKEVSNAITEEKLPIFIFFKKN